eukprot:SAG25_NODE_301_length_10166_cov_46.413927_1_plen_167_part_00
MIHAGDDGIVTSAPYNCAFTTLHVCRTQKNKATNGHLGLLKAKLSKLKRELVDSASKGGGGGGGDGKCTRLAALGQQGHQDVLLPGFEVSKSGDARVGLVGFPSVGKSTLLSKLTSTQSESAAYEFTTLTAIPGTIHYKVRAQPPTAPCAHVGSGAGADLPLRSTA